MEVSSLIALVSIMIVVVLVLLWQMSRLETRIAQQTRSSLDSAESRLGEKISQDVRYTLQSLFQPIQKRGAIGEAILQDLLQDVLPIDRFKTQYDLNGSRVDAIVMLEGGIVPIDSKFPFDNYLQMLEASDEKERSRAARNFATNVRKHVSDIRSKYIQPSAGTFEFALMFIPSEAIYYEIATGNFAASNGKNLFEYAAAEGVFPVSPGTLYPYLSTIALGLRGLHIEKHTREIINTIEQIELNYKNLGIGWRKAQKQLSDAQKNLEDVMQHIDDTSDHLSRTFKYVYSGSLSDLGTGTESD